MSLISPPCPLPFHSCVVPPHPRALLLPLPPSSSVASTSLSVSLRFEGDCLSSTAELPFKSIDGSPETDSSFLSSLRTSLSYEGEEPGPIDWATSSVVKTLRLAETDVQKV